MAILRRLSLPVFFVLILPCFVEAKTSTSGDEVTRMIRQLLSLYSQKDVAGVMKLFAEGEVLMMGSDLTEVYTNREQAAELLRNDFKLWDSSSFGSLGPVYTQESGTFVTAFFDVPFTFRRAGSQQTVVVRFATVWKKTPDGLKLLQSMNTTPTVGQSAMELSSPRP